MPDTEDSLGNDTTAHRLGDANVDDELFENKTVQLFDLANDIGEQTNLSKTGVQKSTDLTKSLHQ
jgi:hypothetical protein